MKIDLEYPFNQKWNRGYLVVNSENRKNVILYNSNKDRTTVSYGRYLMSVHLNRFLNSDEHVDHIDNDKTNDEIDNLQILSLKENNLKESKRRGRQKVLMKCSICSNEFIRRKGNSPLVESKKYSIPVCSEVCKTELNKLHLTKTERLYIINKCILEVFVSH